MTLQVDPTLQARSFLTQEDIQIRVTNRSRRASDSSCTLYPLYIPYTHPIYPLCNRNITPIYPQYNPYVWPIYPQYNPIYPLYIPDILGLFTHKGDACIPYALKPRTRTVGLKSGHSALGEVVVAGSTRTNLWVQGIED